MATGAITSPFDDAPSPIMMAHSKTASSSSSSAIADDTFEDGCSICLEPFSSHDPPTVTNCKHEYHLHCILEWSQRSKECPICWQSFVLKDPTSQELLAAVESERSMRSRNNIRSVHQNHEVNHDISSDDSDFEEQIQQHFAASRSIAHLVNRRRRQTSSPTPQVLRSVSVPLVSNISQNQDPPGECRILSYGVEVGLPATSAPASTMSSAFPSVVNQRSNNAEDRDNPPNHRIFFGQQLPDGPPRSSSSELLAFSESVKAKVSAASARYKESISKSTRGFKEKLLAKNNSMKELSRGVQREMSAGIAGVARMIERLDLSSKRTVVTVPLSSCSEDTSNLAYKGKDVKSVMTKPPSEIIHDMSSDVFSSNSPSNPGQMEVPLAQSKS